VGAGGRRRAVYRTGSVAGPWRGRLRELAPLLQGRPFGAGDRVAEGRKPGLDDAAHHVALLDLHGGTLAGRDDDFGAAIEAFEGRAELPGADAVGRQSERVGLALELHRGAGHGRADLG